MNSWMSVPLRQGFFSFSEKVTEIWTLWPERGQQKSAELTKADLFLWTSPFLCLWPKSEGFLRHWSLLLSLGQSSFQMKWLTRARRGQPPRFKQGHNDTSITNVGGMAHCAKFFIVLFSSNSPCKPTGVGVLLLGSLLSRLETSPEEPSSVSSYVNADPRE